ncbi:MAG: 3-isopropylmalate dehydrogenase [Christensenellales bacterium]|jgi:3-isopropylmalate dehydrogenase
MEFRIAVIKGDGIGPEILDATLRVLGKIETLYNHKFVYDFVDMGGIAIDKYGVPLPEETLSACLAADSVLLGAVGGPKWDTLPGHLRPESGLLGLRKGMGLFANIRPAILLPSLKEACPLRADIRDKGIDMVIVRELTGGLYFGEKGSYGEGEEHTAFDTLPYSVAEIRRIAKVAFDIALGRKKKVTSIDKANVLESSRLWRKTVHEVAKDYPALQVEDMLVDNAAMQLVKNPSQFDVIVTENMFGDIISDEAAQVSGSIGILASGSVGADKKGLYEPIHGSAPDIAGKDLANPIATIISAAMMLKDSFGLKAEHNSIIYAINKTLEANFRTADIADAESDIVGCAKMGQLITQKLQ